MRNPIRLKNLQLRLLPYIVIGCAVAVLREPPPEGFLFGLPLVAAGVVLRSWGAGHLVKNDSLTTTGPYAHLRHPLYLGTLLVATGFALLLGGVWSLGLLAVVWPWFVFQYFPRKDHVESARLAALHGEAYARYHAGVPGLWPRLRAWRDDREPVAQTAERATATWRLERYSDNNELGTVIAILAAVLLFGLRAGVCSG